LEDGKIPKNTKVHKMYEAIKRDELASGASEKAAKAKAARIAQSETGKSLATGKKPKRK
jgi:hypothetical protein